MSDFFDIPTFALPRSQTNPLVDAFSGVIDILDPHQKMSGFGRYENDWVGFVHDHMPGTLTDEQLAIVRSVQDTKVTIVPSATSVGKSHVGAALTAIFYAIHTELEGDTQIYLIAAPPSSNLDTNLLGKLKSIHLDAPELFIGSKVTARGEIKHNKKPLSFVKGVTIPQEGTEEKKESRMSGKHAPYIFVVVDEGDGVPDFVFRAVRGWLSGGKARLVIFYNPKERAGEVFNMRQNRGGNVIQLSAFDHPNVVSGENVIPGARTRNSTLIEIHDWTEPISDDEAGRLNEEQWFAVPDYLVGAVAVADDGGEYPPMPAGKRRIVEGQFSTKTLGQYPVGGRSHLLLDITKYQEAVERFDTYVAIHGRNPMGSTGGVVGYDPAGDGSDVNMLCFRFGSLVIEFVSWEGIDGEGKADMACDEIVKFWVKYRLPLARAVVDGIGVGDEAPQNMRRRIRDERLWMKHGVTMPDWASHFKTSKVKFSQSPRGRTKKEKFANLRAECYWNLREWLIHDPSVMLPDNEFVRQAMGVITYEQTPKGILLLNKRAIRKRLGRSPNELDALAQTFIRPKSSMGSAPNYGSE